MSDDHNGKAHPRASQATLDAYEASRDFKPHVRLALVAKWTELAELAEEAKLARVLAERTASILRKRRNMLERVSPIEVGVFAIELATLGELLEVLDYRFGRACVLVAGLTVAACSDVLDTQAALVAEVSP